MKIKIKKEKQKLTPELEKYPGYLLLRWNKKLDMILKNFKSVYVK